ncbi:MAG: cobalamin B12-binding domain-containing protein [Phycisphaerales bacterium]|nr:cobalamin B12-binding domain-containing protein [Phycisphaerales bacterium]
MTEIFENIQRCIETGKADASLDIPRGSAGKPGVAEFVDQALAEGISATEILQKGMLPGMKAVGKRFAAHEIFIPEVLISARAMHAGFAVLKPAFAQEDVPSQGTFVIGTVAGDLHDIGKNLVAIILEGAGWKVVDLGTDCAPEKFAAAVVEHPGCIVGLSALLTTTMINMPAAIAAIRAVAPSTRVLVGGAPVTADYAKEVGADGYAVDPMGALAALENMAA